MNISSVFIKGFVVAVLPAMISACHSFKSVEQSAQFAQVQPAPAAFVLPASASEQQPVAAWWAQLNDEQLNQLIANSLQQNHSIRIAQASLAESRALLRNSKLDRYPTIEAGVSGARQKQSADIVGDVDSRISETYQAGFDASWELDIFGRVRNGVKLSKAQLAAREADLQAAQVSIAAEVAGAYISLRGNQYLLDVALRNVLNQQETLELAQRFSEVGRGDQLDVARAEAQLELTRASIPALNAEINIALNRIGVLTGTPSAELKTALALVKSLPQIPASFAVGNPTDLLKRRPDIRRAEQALAGAVAEYNIRVADLYPSVTFTGGLGYLSSDWTRVGNSNTDTFLFSPRIEWAAFNLGRVDAQIDAADARTQARIAEFEQQVLTALAETDSALQNFTREEERRTSLQRALQASNQAAVFARKRFEVGSSDFLTVLDAERSQLTLSAQLAQSDMQVLLNLIAVYKSLGGGWEFAQQSALATRN
ncbi:efflux transporter outer membrane subunit [Cellvibrio sp. KY-YJ-3]|uniref:efflux transporter outer membrane subunit n=1 Tax=Cellvibrio sp. KY-YJ-3 TaxID=454662 RepID=UPI001243D115|nr:efflux transporter outer membrane subunit [Cellvibrio sp. KY-YJ-3]QEY10887.1 efflux transporter outer membrane subunit [Cellvibrio sp. KY-YJ-3]